MEMRHDAGIDVMLLSAEEALRLDRRAIPPRTDVVRVAAPPRETWGALAERGFVRKPAWLVWYSDVGAGEEEWLARLSKGVRYDIRRCRRQAHDELRIELQQPIRPETLDRFLEVYESMVARMRHGVPFATSLRDAILADERHWLLYAHSTDGFAGGLVCREDEETGTVLFRFAAIRPRWRERSLQKVLYVEATSVARAKGFRRVSAGNDPNLYGHIAKPGLMTSKARLGFTPYPADPPTGPGSWRDEADLVIALDRLGDLALILGYPDGLSGGDEQPFFDLAVYGDPRLGGGIESLPFVRSVRRHIPCRPAASPAPS
ncbi:hypothetical protein Acsp04_63090 [Actinomadura sp. NBRC 104425]|nr:hypothetical protein Acsp04_63090 [Actinomadura sp. NBRC 104425]